MSFPNRDFETFETSVKGVPRRLVGVREGSRAARARHPPRRRLTRRPND